MFTEEELEDLCHFLKGALSRRSRKPRKRPKPPKTLTNPKAEALRKYLETQFPQRKRVSKYAGPVRPFKLDDRTEADTWKWQISVGVEDTDLHLLSLVLHSVPQDSSVVRFVQGLGGLVILQQEHATLKIIFKLEDVTIIRQLAGLIRSVKTDRFEWLTKRAADSLIRLAHHLDRVPPE